MDADGRSGAVYPAGQGVHCCHKEIRVGLHAVQLWCSIAVCLCGDSASGVPQGG